MYTEQATLNGFSRLLLCVSVTAIIIEEEAMNEEVGWGHRMSQNSKIGKGKARNDVGIVDSSMKF